MAARLVERRCGPRFRRVGQVLPVEQLHHEVVPRVGQPPNEKMSTMLRVADLVDRARLVDEARDQLAGSTRCAVSTLIATRLPITGWTAGVDGAHAALADLALDAVLADLHPLG